MAYTTPIHNLTIDWDKCGNARPCKKCAWVCVHEAAHNCIVITQKEVPVPTEDWPKSDDDIVYIPIPKNMWECSGCKKCVEICPKGAIEFIPAKRHLPRAKLPRPDSLLNCTVLADGRKCWEPGYEEEIIWIDD